MLLILSSDDVTLQFFVWKIYFCVLKYIKFKVYEKPVLQIAYFCTKSFINMIANKDKPVN